jgi:hypothetical protein
VHLRVAQPGRTRLLDAALVAGCLALASSLACTRERSADIPLRIAWAIDPAPPAAGVSTLVRVVVSDDQQQPVTGARLRLEGHMSHPGMTPVTADMIESTQGTYEAQLQFSMAGDWLLVVAGALSDGTRVTQQLELAGVKPGA